MVVLKYGWILKRWVMMLKRTVSPFRRQPFIIVLFIPITTKMMKLVCKLFLFAAAGANIN